jgi:ABC-type nitrate/sulfonate/bicarbonate transport system substrate-binding protein
MARETRAAGRTRTSRPTLGWFLPAAVAGLLAVLAVPALGISSDRAASPVTYRPGTPEAGTSIPKATIRLGMRPYADNTFYVIGMRRGWFKNVGISIAPAPYGLKTTEDQWINLLLNGQVDINSATCGNMLPSYRTSRELKCAGFADTFNGLVMLANPKLKLKTLRQYAGAGGSFRNALRQALSPLVGKTVYVPTALAAKPFNEVPFQLAGLSLPDYVPMDDSQMLLLAKSDRLDFMNPGGAPIAQTMLDLGWTPVYDTVQLLQYGPGGVNSPLEALVFNNGWAAKASYINRNQTTMLRFASVVFRTISELRKNPALYGVYAPYLNSVAGTSLNADGVKRTVEQLSPLVPFEQQTKYFNNKKHAEYFGNSMGALITSLRASNAIPEGITPAEIVWAAPMYKELVSYKTRTDRLLKQAKGRKLPAAKQRLLREARKYYGWYDFLDAYRFARAAVG